MKHVRANDYELWATGAVGTCNPSQLVFVYGYYSIIFVVAANIYYEYEDITEKLFDFKQTSLAELRQGKQSVVSLRDWLISKLTSCRSVSADEATSEAEELLNNRLIVKENSV